MTACRAVVASKLDRKIGNTDGRSNTSDKCVRFECCIDQFRGQVNVDGVDIVGCVGRDLDSGNFGGGCLSLSDLCKVCVAAEDVVVGGVAEANIEMIECLLPRGLCD